MTEKGDSIVIKGVCTMMDWEGKKIHISVWDAKSEWRSVPIGSGVVVMTEEQYERLMSNVQSIVVTPAPELTEALKNAVKQQPGTMRVQP